MKCKLCGKPVVLVPSANERAKSTGYPVSYFQNLFDTHSDCAIAKREADTLELMRRTNKGQA